MRFTQHSEVISRHQIYIYFGNGNTDLSKDYAKLENAEPALYTA